MDNFKIQKIAIIAGLVVLFGMNGFLGYHNARMSAEDANPEQALKREQTQVALVKADVERATKIKTQAPEIQKFFENFEGTLPAAGKGYSVISQEFDEVSRDTHVQVQDVKFRQKDVTGRNVDEVEIQATVVGDYAGIVKFLNRLQRSKNTYIVDSLGLDSENLPGQGAQAPSGTVRVSLNLKSYFRKA
jgi:hypothetical protein